MAPDRITRVGIGRDIHRLFPGKPLILAGVEIPGPSGFDTHSDGDVVCHALIDALAGALAAGDLGTHYPEDDPDTQDARSLDFVYEFSGLLKSRDVEILNIDCFVVLREPRLQPHFPAMRKSLADAIGTSEDRVSIKARSNDGLPPEGTGEAASATVAVLVSVSPTQ